MSNHYYVIPDIHGEHELLDKTLSEIYVAEPNGCKIIFLGDYIDRGPNSPAVLKIVMNPPEKYEFVCLKGNHEDMFLGAIDKVNNFYEKKIFNKLRHAGIVPIGNAVAWMRRLKIFHQEGNNIFAHAAYDASIPPQEQSPEFVLWARYPDTAPFYSDYGFYLTHGHTPRENGPILSPNRCNLDAGAVFYGRLVYAQFDYDKTGPQQFFEVYK